MSPSYNKLTFYCLSITSLLRNYLFFSGKLYYTFSFQKCPLITFYFYFTFNSRFISNQCGRFNSLSSRVVWRKHIVKNNICTPEFLSTHINMTLFSQNVSTMNTNYAFSWSFLMGIPSIVSLIPGGGIIQTGTERCLLDNRSWIDYVFYL